MNATAKSAAALSYTEVFSLNFVGLYFFSFLISSPPEQEKPPAGGFHKCSVVFVYQYRKRLFGFGGQRFNVLAPVVVVNDPAVLL